jgi:hypothetical protein
MPSTLPSSIDYRTRFVKDDAKTGFVSQVNRLTILEVGASSPDKQKASQISKKTMTGFRPSANTIVEDDAKTRFSHDTTEKLCMSPMMTGECDQKADDDACPDSMSETSSVKSSYEEDEAEDEDAFAIDGVPMPRISSSTVPIVLMVAPRTGGGFDSKDPLFRGVCLYSGSMASEEREDIKPQPEELLRNKATSTFGGLSWLLRVPSRIFSSTS